jgi:nitroreductase
MDRTRQHPILDLIHRRASAEDFDAARGLDGDEVRRLVEDATRAPSAFNIQHWRFVAVASPAGKARLKRAAYGQEHVARAAVTFIVLGDPQGAERLPAIMETAVERGAIAEGKAAAWIRMTREIYADPGVARDEAIRSASLAAMTMMLAAEARGLVACALTGFDPAVVVREFGIDPRLVPVMLIAVGHPAGPVAPRMPRMAVEDVLVFERWPGPDRDSQ